LRSRSAEGSTTQLGSSDHDFTERGGNDRTCSALQERGPETLFQVLDALREGRLCQVDRFRGTTKAAVFNDRQKMLELADLSHDHRLLSN